MSTTLLFSSIALLSSLVVMALSDSSDGSQSWGSHDQNVHGTGGVFTAAGVHDKIVIPVGRGGSHPAMVAALAADE